MSAIERNFVPEAAVVKPIDNAAPIQLPTFIEPRVIEVQEDKPLEQETDSPDYVFQFRQPILAEINLEPKHITLSENKIVRIGVNPVDYVGQTEDEYKTEYAEFPWANRTAREWTVMTSKDDVLKLLKYAQHESQGKDLESIKDWYQKWDFGEVVNVFWNGSFDTLEQELTSYNKIHLSRENISEGNQETKDHLTLLEEIFSDNTVYQYFNIANKLISEKNTHSDSSLQNRIQQKMQLSDEEFNRLQEKYHRLTEALMPVADRVTRSRMKRTIRRTPEDFEDWRGIGHMRLSAAVLSYYWEPAAINKELALEGFYGFLSKSIWDTRAIKFDTRTLEVHCDDLTQFSDGKGCDVVALQNISDEYVNEIISNFTSEQNQKIIRMKMDGDAEKEIAEALSIDKQRVKYVVSSFRDALRKNRLQIGDRTLSPEDRQLKKGVTFLDQTFPQDHYQKLLANRGAMLRPYLRKLVESLLEVQTGEKQSTLSALQEIFPDSQKDTIRRHLESAIDILEGKQDKNFTSIKGLERERWKQTVLQISQNDSHGLWSSLNSRDQHIMQKYFIDGVNQSEVAKELGIDRSLVSRSIDRCKRNLLRYTGTLDLNRQVFQNGYSV